MAFRCRASTGTKNVLRTDRRTPAQCRRPSASERLDSGLFDETKICSIQRLAISNRPLRSNLDNVSVVERSNENLPDDCIRFWPCRVPSLMSSRLILELPSHSHSGPCCNQSPENDHTGGAGTPQCVPKARCAAWSGDVAYLLRWLPELRTKQTCATRAC